MHLGRNILKKKTFSRLLMHCMPIQDLWLERIRSAFLHMYKCIYIHTYMHCVTGKLNVTSWVWAKNSTNPHASHPWKPSRGTETRPLTKRWHHSSHHIRQKKRHSIRNQWVPTKTLRPHSKLPLTGTFVGCWPIFFDVHDVRGWDAPSPFTTHFSHHFQKGPFYHNLRIGHFCWIHVTDHSFELNRRLRYTFSILPFNLVINDPSKKVQDHFFFFKSPNKMRNKDRGKNSVKKIESLAPNGFDN